MDKIIEHFITMQKQSEKSLGTPGNAREELSEWHRGLYSGERQAYGHCIEYLRRHLSEQSTLPDKAGLPNASHQAYPADEITLGEILQCPRCQKTGKAKIFRR